MTFCQAEAGCELIIRRLGVGWVGLGVRVALQLVSAGVASQLLCPGLELSIELEAQSDRIS